MRRARVVKHDERRVETALDARRAVERRHAPRRRLRRVSLSVAARVRRRAAVDLRREPVDAVAGDAVLCARPFSSAASAAPARRRAAPTFAKRPDNPQPMTDRCDANVL